MEVGCKQALLTYLSLTHVFPTAPSTAAALSGTPRYIDATSWVESANQGHEQVFFGSLTL